MKRWSLVAFFSLTISAALFLSPYLGTDTPHMFDQYLHLERMGAFKTALSDGFAIPTWTTHLAYGFGSPVFLFNWTLPYYAASVLLVTGISLVMTYKILIILTVIGMAYFMYKFLALMFSPAAALIGTTMYIWAPYHFNIIHLRGAIGEAFAMMLWPALFWSSRRSMRNKRQGSIRTVFCWILLMLSHQALFLIILPLWILLISSDYLSKQSRLSTIHNLLSLFFGMGMTVFAWLPAYIERSFLGYGYQESIYADNFISLRQLVSQPSVLEFGLHFGRMFYALGWIPILTLGLSVWFIASEFLRTRSLGKLVVPILFMTFALLAVFLTQPVSKFLWDSLPLLDSIGYPQRFLGLAVFSVSVLGAWLFQLIPKRFNVSAAISFVILVLLSGLPFVYLNPERDTEAGLLRLMTPLPDTTDVWGEFSPKGIPKDFIRQNGPIYGKQPMISVSPAGKITPACDTSSASVHCVIRTTTPSVIRLRQFWFPGWTASWDNGSLSLQKAEDGTMKTTIPGPTEEILFVFRDTPIREISQGVSVMFLLCYLWYLKRIHEPLPTASS